MSLDQFASTVSTRTSHPKGEFVGVVEAVKMEKTQKGVNLITIKTKTSHGYPPLFRLGYITEEDYSKASFLNENGDGSGLTKIANTISMTKSSLVRLGLVTPEAVDKMGYKACISEFPKLNGKKVKIIVSAQKNNPQYDETRLEKHEAVEAQNNTAPSNGFSVDDAPF